MRETCTVSSAETVSRGRVKPQSRDRDALVNAIKEIVADYQNTKPMSDDIL